MEVVEKGAFSELQPRSGFEMLTKLVATAPFGMARSQFHASYRTDLEDSGSTVLAEVRRGPRSVLPPALWSASQARRAPQSERWRSRMDDYDVRVAPPGS
jgi:hypothetical protein